MKRVLGLLSLFFAANLLAVGYSGTGTWVSSKGETGEYKVDADISLANEMLVIEQTLNFGENNTLQTKFSIRKIDDTFFEVLSGDDQEVVGNGYCFTLPADEKVCHSESLVGNDLFESTMKKTANAIYRVGSKTDLTTGDQIVWKDALTPKPIKTM